MKPARRGLSVALGETSVHSTIFDLLLLGVRIPLSHMNVLAMIPAG